MQLIEPHEYYQQLLTMIPRAKSRIVLAAMVVHADAKTLPIFTAIEAALKRGVSVHILVDSFYRSEASREGGRPRHEHLKIIADTSALLEKLRQQGARISIFGRLGINPFKHRCHVKVSIIDDDVFSFGGINFAAGSFESADYMLYDHSADLGDSLELLVDKIGSNNGSMPDFEQPLDEKNAILFDGGVPGTSIIYERAAHLARRAARIYYVSQMAPSGPLAQALRQTIHECYFNRPSQGASFLKLSLYVDGIVNQIKNLYRRDKFIHAKYILFELKDGTKALVSGSNNFSWRGVAYGTQEIALYSTDEVLWGYLYSFLKQSIAKEE